MKRKRLTDATNINDITSKLDEILLPYHPIDRIRILNAFVAGYDIDGMAKLRGNCTKFWYDSDFICANINANN